MIDYPAILSRHYRGSEWTLDGEEYSGLTWISDTPKPSQEELDGLWDETVALMEQEKADEQAARDALLARLGISEDEARMLLG
jgi:hypothetical protein